MIAVDDAHLLDDASATVLGHLATSRAAFIVMTALAGEPIPDAVMALWKDGTARRLDLPGLSEADVDRLLDSSLGGEVDGVSRRRLHRAVGGNPLTLRELVRAGIAGRTLRQRYGVWRWDPGPATRATQDAAPGAEAERMLRLAAASPGSELGDGARSRILLFDGCCGESLAIAGRVLDRPGADDQAVVWAATVATAAAGFLGQCDEAMRYYQRGRTLAAKRAAEPRDGVVELGYAGCLANLASGNLRLAWDLAEDGYRDAVEARAPLAAGGWSALRGMVAAAQGSLTVAGPALREAVAALEDNDPLGFVPLCLACLGAVTALAGDPAAGRTWLDRADRWPGQGNRLFAPWVEQWRAWAVAASRSATAAVVVAEEAARLARAARLPTIETAALYDVVRLGGGLRPRLGALAAGLRTPLAGGLMVAAGGLTNADGDALASATATFDGLGHHLLAAEVAAAAGQVYRRSGRRGSAQVYAEKAALLRARCAGARTPLLDADGVTELLTPGNARCCCWLPDTPARRSRGGLGSRRVRSTTTSPAHTRNWACRVAPSSGRCSDPVRHNERPAQ